MEAIDKLSWKASCGPDGWSAKLLKGLKIPISNWLEIIYEKSMNEGQFPKILKETFINGIFKGGDKSIPSNYRPIALTSHLSKTMERVLRKDIVDFLTFNSLWDKRQHGSRGGHSTLSQLLLHYNEIMDKLERKSNCDVIYLDFSKAYDKVDFSTLLLKIRALGIHGNIGS